MNQEAAPPANEPATLLFIDDEANILAALKRLFRPLGYNILTAENGPDGLALLEKENVDLVICDMRMPQMSGAEVLEQIHNRWPEVVRILLTGYSDLTSTIAAINRGEIYRYISKPWDDNDIALVVRDALERKHLLAEKLRLEALTQQQNEELKELNASLEEKVRQRTEQLRAALDSLDHAHERLKQDYFATIQVFANLMELRKGAMAGHSRRVAQLCRNIAQQMGLTEDYIQTIETAALLHNIGKIGLPDRLLDQPYFELPYADRAEFDKHPLRAGAALMALDPLVQAAELIRHHLDHYDGMGNRSGLRGEAIPLGARILLVASDYDALQQGLLGHERMTPEQAQDTIDKGSGMRYDPAVVGAFRRIIGSSAQYGHINAEFQVTSNQLHEGMLLTHDVITKDGMLLLLKDTVLNVAHIRDIKEFEASAGELLAIFTHTI
ncbi:MAG: response regulator [Gallionella sp.]|jgi:response regulator RpfG family c-di-GMP phosphodiesterase|nr:response regulator [Gallionella sp.]MCK9353009.1 response regulator [Gallionella sp.]